MSARKHRKNQPKSAAPMKPKSAPTPGTPVPSGGAKAAAAPEAHDEAPESDAEPSGSAEAEEAASSDEAASGGDAGNDEAKPASAPAPKQRAARPRRKPGESHLALSEVSVLDRAITEPAPLGLPKKPRVPPAERLKVLLPDILALVGPHKRVMAVGMFLILVTRASALVGPYSLKFLVDDVIGRKQLNLLGPLALAVGAAAILQTLSTYALAQLFGRSTQRLVAEIRCKLQSHIQRLPLLYHDANKSGALGSRIMQDVAGLQNLVGTGLLQFTSSLATAVLALILMGRFSLLMSAIALVAVLGFGILIGRATGRLRAIARERSEVNADVIGRLTESLGGIRVIKGYHAEEREELVFAGGMQRILANFVKQLTFSSRLGLSTNLLWGIVGAVVMFIGAQQIVAGKMSLGEFFTFTLLLNLLVAPLLQLVGVGSQVTEALAGIERTREIMKVEPEDADPRREVELDTINGDVVMENVNFSYAPGKEVLTDFSLHATPGTMTALVGPSGSGKSTTIGLIASFYTPTSGKILVDGTDLGTVRLDSYRTQLGVVLQETFLFDGTIFENVSFARPSATREEVLSACRTARVDEFVQTFEEKYDTVVGERGVKLSGGQRQRISIARAILADPRILILDEATSSLDSHSEALIQEALAHLLKGRTTFVIAHRLSTIRKADQILVVDRGRIVERGTHASLCDKRGLYYDMYTKQHQTEQDLFLAPGEVPVEEPEKKKKLAGMGGLEDADSLLSSLPTT